MLNSFILRMLFALLAPMALARKVLPRKRAGENRDQSKETMKKRGRRTQLVSVDTCPPFSLARFMSLEMFNAARWISGFA